MSASNWRVCPKCIAKGTDPVDDGLGPETFREDYHIGMQQDGMFYIRYSGRCVTCGFSFDFQHEELNTHKDTDRRKKS